MNGWDLPNVLLIKILWMKLIKLKARKVILSVVMKKRKRTKGVKPAASGSKKEPTRKELINELDKLWSKLVKERDGKCVICGSLVRLNAHHIFSRSNFGTRYDINNGITLCWAHHLHLAHTHFERFRDFVIERIGQEMYDILKEKAYSVVKLSVEDLKGIKNEMHI